MSKHLAAGRPRRATAGKHSRYGAAPWAAAVEAGQADSDYDPAAAEEAATQENSEGSDSEQENMSQAKNRQGAKAKGKGGGRHVGAGGAAAPLRSAPAAAGAGARGVRKRKQQQGQRHGGQSPVQPSPQRKKKYLPTLKKEAAVARAAADAAAAAAGNESAGEEEAAAAAAAEAAAEAAEALVKEREANNKGSKAKAAGGGKQAGAGEKEAKGKQGTGRKKLDGKTVSQPPANKWWGQPQYSQMCDAAKRLLRRTPGMTLAVMFPLLLDDEQSGEPGLAQWMQQKRLKQEQLQTWFMGMKKLHRTLAHMYAMMARRAPPS